MNDLRKLELTAIFTTLLAYCLTVVLVGSGYVHEANPFTAGAVERFGWAPAGIVAVIVIAGAFALFRRVSSYRYHGVRVSHVGAFLIASLGVVDLGVNLIRFAQVGTRALALESFVAEVVPVVIATIVVVGFPLALRAREPVADPSIRRALHRFTTAVLVVCVVTSTFVGGFALVGTQSFDGDSGVARAASSGDIVYQGNGNGGVEALYQSNGTVVWSVSPHSDIVNSISVAPSGDVIYTGSQDNTVKALNASDGSVIWSSSVNSYSVNSVSASPNGNKVYSTNQNGVVKAIDTSDGSEVWSVKPFSSASYAISAGPDGNQVYAGGFGGEVKSLDPADGSVIWNYSANSDTIESVSVSPDGATVYGVTSAFASSKVMAIDTSTGGLNWSVTPHGDHILSVSASVSGDKVYTGSADNTIKALDASDGSQIWSKSSTNTVNSIAPSSDGELVFEGGADTDVEAFDASNGDHFWTYQDTTDVYAVATQWRYFEPAKLSNLSTSSTNSTSTDLTWEANKIDTTRVEYKPTDASTWTTFSTLSGTTTTETLSGLKNGEAYDVRVVADSDSTIKSTTTFTTTLPAEDQPVLTTPAEGQITVDRETATTNNGDVVVQYRENGSSTWTTHTTVPFDFTTIDISNLSGDTEYEVRLQPKTEHVTGSFTNPVSATTVPYTESVSGVVTDQNGETASNATVEIVGVDKSQVTLEQGETYEQKANELLDKASSPLPASYDSDLQITGEGGVAQQASGEYVAIHRPEDWATQGWVDTIELDNPTVNPPSGELITFSVWNPSKGEGALTLQNTIDDDLRGAVVNRTVVIEQLDPYGDVVDRRKLTANRNKRTGFGPGARDHPYVSTSLPPGVYRVYAEGDKQNAYLFVAGNVGDLRESFATDLENQAGESSKAAQRIQEKLNDGKFVRKTVTTNSSGHYSTSVPENVAVVAVSAYKIDGNVLTSMQNPTPQDMRAYVKNNDYNGSVYFAVEPVKYEAPTNDADVTVRKFSSPPYALLDSWASKWDNYRDLLENGTLTELGTMYSVPLTEWNKTQKETGAEDLAKIIESNNQELIEKWEEQRNEDWEQFKDELEQSERTNQELREDIRSMEEVISSLQSELKSEPPETSVGDGAITFRQAFDGDFEKADVIATWNDYDGSTTPIPDEYISVNKRIGQGDVVVVEDYPVSDSSAGGQVSITVVSEDGEIGHGSEQIENPSFTGEIPELRSIDASTLRPGPGETVTLSPRFDSAGVSVAKVGVFDDSGSKISSSLSNGKAKFTPENSGIYFVRFTFNTTDGDSFVQSLRMPVESTSHDWPASVYVRDGRLGTFAVAGANVKDAKVTMKDSGGGISATALVEPDSGVNEVHFYLEGAPQGVEQSITTRVIEGSSVDTGTSISRHVGVFVHGREIGSNAAVYRRGGGIDGSKIPIPHDGETRGGQIRQDENGGTVIHSYTSSNGETTITIDNNPDRVEGWQYSLALFIEQRDIPFTIIVPDLVDFGTTIVAGDLVDPAVDVAGVVPIDVAGDLVELVDDAGGVMIEFDVDAPGVGTDPTADLPSTGAIA